MIKIRIRNADHEIDIRFPISESELYAKLAEIHAVEHENAAQSAYVTEVYWPEEFLILKNWYANLDELNYLARRMESFDALEYDQFLIGISKLDSKELKDLINLTFNLHHFALCQDVSSYGKIGREYVLNTEGSVPAYDEDDPKYAAIGKELIDRGLAQITAKGLLILRKIVLLRLKTVLLCIFHGGHSGIGGDSLPWLRLCRGRQFHRELNPCNSFRRQCCSPPVPR